MICDLDAGIFFNPREDGRGKQPLDAASIERKYLKGFRVRIHGLYVYVLTINLLSGLRLRLCASFSNRTRDIIYCNLSAIIAQ